MPIVKNINHFQYWVETYPFYSNVKKEGVSLYAAQLNDLGAPKDLASRRMDVAKEETRTQIESARELIKFVELFLTNNW